MMNRTVGHKNFILRYYCIHSKLDFQNNWMNAKVVVLQGDIRSFSLLKFPYLSRQLFGNFIRGPARKILNAYILFIFNSNKNSSRLFALLCHYFRTQSPP
jgi:hypothetical protein